MVQVPASIGELIDKITILEIKRDRIDDAAKLLNVNRELDVLQAVVMDSGFGYPVGQLADLGAKLRTVNSVLWTIEDDIRECERRQDFGDQFIALARAVYRRNDERAALKREINVLMGSDLVEEKSYAAY
jgi:hypothetical protein